MYRKRIEQYYQAYNLSVQNAIETYYTGDCVFEYSGIKWEGKAAIAKQLIEFQKAFSEEIIPLNILTGNDAFAVEVENRLKAKFDTVFEGKTLKTGETLTAKYAAFYDTRGNQIRHVRLYKV